MRKLIYKAACTILLGVLLFQPLSAKTFPDKPEVEKELVVKKEFTRTIKKEYAISADGLVGMTNKYGKVEIKTWDQNQVKAEVTITVNAGSEEKAEATFDRIKIEFSNAGDFVKGETNIESVKKSWMSSWWGDSDNPDFTIDYEVYMPATCNLELSNKYGHSTVEKISGKATVVAKYGDVRMDGVDNNLNLDIGYGNATVESVRDADVNIKYGKLRVEAARDVNLESKYSKVYISKAGDLESTSKYDTYRLGEIRDLQNQGKYDDFEIDVANDVNAISRYSDFEVGRLMQRGEFNLEYGGLRIDKLDKGFAKMEVDAKYTDIKIGTEPGSHYELDIATSYAGVHTPSEADLHYQVQQGSSKEVRGNVGGKGSNSLIHIRASYGSVKIW